MTSRSIVAASLVLTAGTALVAQQRQAADPKAKLRNPAALVEKAPDLYKAKFDTSAGIFTIEVHRDWAPLGADRFYNLVKNGYYDDVRFFRVLEGFMAQFGMNGDPAIQALWGKANFKDDPVKESNKRAYVTFAKTGLPNSRSTQVFINFPIVILMADYIPPLDDHRGACQPDNIEAIVHGNRIFEFFPRDSLRFALDRDHGSTVGDADPHRAFWIRGQIGLLYKGGIRRMMQLLP